MRVAHAEGSDVARSAAGRAGAEAVWLPTALLPRFGVHWAATDSNHVVASYRLDDTELELQLDLDDHGRLCSVVLERWGGTDAIGSWGRFSTLGDSSVRIADRRRVAVSTPRLSGIRVRQAKRSRMSMSKNGNAVLADAEEAFAERPERVEELVLAGIALLERKPKKFRKAVQRGRKAERQSNAYTGVLSRLNAPSPVYVRPGGGGGWYEVWVRGVPVAKVQGEEAALRRMAELTLEYVRADEAERAAPTSIRASGGGWYDLIAHGVVVDRVQGEQEAHSRVEEFSRGTARV